MDKNKVYVLENCLKLFGGVIVLILGIVFLCLSGNTGLQSAINYCVATVMLVIGLFAICMSFLLGKGILSFEVILGIILSSFAILFFIKNTMLSEAIGILFSSIMIFAGATILVEIIICFVQHNIKRAIIYIIIDVILLGLGITILVLNLTSDTFGATFLNILIGIAFVVIGAGFDAYVITKIIKNDKDKEKEKEPIKTNKVKKAKKKKRVDTPLIEEKNDVIDVKESDEGKEDKKKEDTKE